VDGVTIRQAEPGDAPGVSQVHVAGWQWAYAGLLPAGYLAGLDPARREAMWGPWLATEEGRGQVAVAVAGGEVIGFIAWGRYHLDDLAPDVLPDAVGEVRALYLAQAHQGRGVGRALLARAVERLAAAGYSEAKLWVLESNALARRFYERQGWAPDGGRLIEDYDGLALPELRYGRPLPS
jgi:ribosomal protein S18 acetylase RimI-like enzyme